jgi:hypothetical protein
MVSLAIAAANKFLKGIQKTLLVLPAVPTSLLAQPAEPANLVVNSDFSQVWGGQDGRYALSAGGST